MKKISIAILSFLLASTMVLNGQDARGRLTQTIVVDALAALPAADVNAYNKELQELAAAAPESVTILASMMQAPEKGANNKIEYALSGLARFASDPANRQYKDKVVKGLQEAISKMADPVNKAYLESELRFLGTFTVAAEPALDAKATLAQVKKLLKSNKSNEMCQALYLQDKVLGAAGTDKLINALKSNDRAYRSTALQYLSKYADDAIFAKVVSKINKSNDETVMDVLNWLSLNNATSQADFVTGKIASGNDELAALACKAAGKLGTAGTTDALIAALGNEKISAAALAALKSTKANITDKVLAALKNPANSLQNNALAGLASYRSMDGAFDDILKMATSGNSKAIKALSGVASPATAATIASLLDKSSGAAVADYAKAYCAAVKPLKAAEQYAAVKSAMSTAKNADRFYNALAQTGTDEAVSDLAAAYKTGSKAALDALKNIDNKKAADILIEAAKTDEAALNRYVDLVMDKVSNIDKRTDNLEKALLIAQTAKAKNKVLSALRSTPTMKSFLLASDCLSDKETAYKAANAVKDIASKCQDDIDGDIYTKSLTKAADVLISTGNMDDSYAVDEIKTLLNAKADVSPIFTLSDEEKKAGFEMLFDGTNLDQWEGNVGGYKIVNNNIYVTAGYGNGGNLYTKKEYRDFTFRFEFSFVRPGANNGVGVRTPHGVDAAYDGMCEVQVLDHDDEIYKEWLQPYQVHGSVYGVIPAKRIKHKPLGEWSTEEIVVSGNHIKVTVNGEVIVDGDISEACQGHNVAPDGGSKNPYTVDHKNHPGMFNQTGYVGFLGHGAGVRFRNVRILDQTQPVKAKKARRK